MATRELERSVAASSLDVVEVTKICDLSEVVFMVQTRIIIFTFLSFRKIGSFVCVKAPAQQNEPTTQTGVVAVKQKAQYAQAIVLVARLQNRVVRR